MKKKGTTKGMMIVGSLRRDGLMTYMKQGRLIVRSAESIQKRSNTLGQFVQRQRMRHATALWTMLKYCQTMFTQRPTAYANFMVLASKLPEVYVERPRMDKASFLMPGIPVSDGTLTTIYEYLGEVDGQPALITNLTKDMLTYRTKLWPYTAVQTDQTAEPHVRFSMREISLREMTLVDGCYALVSDEFTDSDKGWALVQVEGERCSPQTIVTRCTFYQQYTTEEAQKAAAKSYGGLTREVLP